MINELKVSTESRDSRCQMKLALIMKQNIFMKSIFFLCLLFPNKSNVLGKYLNTHPFKLKKHLNSNKSYKIISKKQGINDHLHRINFYGGSDSSKAWSFGSSAPQYPTTTPSGRQQRRQNINYPIVEDITDQEEKENQAIAKDMMDSFLSRDNRNSFIARVYGILTLQLIVTALTVVYFSTHRHIPMWMAFQGRMIIPSLCLIISSAVMIYMSFSQRARQVSPLKWQLLSLFTLSESTLVGFLCSFYPFQTVVLAFLTTAVATGSITMYTIMQKNPKYDLSQTGRMLSSASMILIFYGLTHLLLPRGYFPFSDLIYSMFGACLFSCYLAYHTRMIVSGKHSKYQMNHKDYVYGAMTLYSDIIQLFLYILRILSDSRDRE